jgi:hypothetical protein
MQNSLKGDNKIKDSNTNMFLNQNSVIPKRAKTTMMVSKSNIPNL